jgi:hypothetical protein
MRNAVAERILRLFTDRERAACIVGDLAETGEQRGSLWFWRSVTFTACRLAMWPAVIFAACMAVQMAVMAPVGRVMNSITAAHGRPAPVGYVLGFSAALMASLTLNAAYRYGFRHTLTRLAGIVTLIAFAGSYLQRTPWVAQSATVVALVLLLAAAIFRATRRASASLLLTFLVSAVGFFAVVMLINTVHFGVPVFPFNYALIVGVQWVACRYWPPPESVVDVGAAVGTSLE